MTRPITSILMIVILLAPSTMVIMTPNPAPAQASVGKSIAQAGGCVGAAWLNSLIDKGLSILKDKISQIANKYIRNLLGSFFEDVPTHDTDTSDSVKDLQGFFQNKYYRDDVIARCLARQGLDNITKNINDVIKTRGRDGGVAFIKNWVTFQTQAQYRGENIFRAELSTAKLCDYLATDIKKSFGVDPKKKTPLTGQNTRTDSLQTFGLAAKCTMPAGFTPQKYLQDFAGNGGWDAYARMLEPQNNAWGLAALSKDEITKQRSLQQSADTNQAIAGRGYTGISGNGKSDNCLVKSPVGTDCLVYKDIKTTASYLADSAAATIGAEYSWLTSAQGLNSIIEDVTQNMINRLFDQTDNNDINIAGDSSVAVGPQPPPGGGTPTACIKQATKTGVQGLMTQRLMVMLKNMTVTDMQIFLRDHSDTINAFMVPLITSVDTFLYSLGQDETSIASKIDGINTDLKWFQQMALGGPNDDEGASEASNMMAARQRIFQAFDGLMAMPICGTTTPTTP